MHWYAYWVPLKCRFGVISPDFPVLWELCSRLAVDLWPGMVYLGDLVVGVVERLGQLVHLVPGGLHLLLQVGLLLTESRQLVTHTGQLLLLVLKVSTDRLILCQCHYRNKLHNARRVDYVI